MLYSEQELNSLIADVEREFTTHLAKAEKSFALAKNDNFQPKDKKVNEIADDKKNSAKDEKQSASENKEGGKTDDSRNEAADESQSGKDRSKEASQDESGKPIEKKADKGAEDQDQQEEGSEEGQADEGQPKPEGHEEGEEHGYDDEDMAHLDSMYGTMSRGELKAHHDSVRKAMDGHGLAKCEDSMMKSEKDVVVKIPQEISLLKSELEAAKAESDKSKKDLAAVETFLKKFVEKTAPMGKAITSLDIIAKTENGQGEKPLQKSEIDAKLLAKAKDSSLSKADRDAINSYYCGSKNIQTVSHLLK